MGNLLLPQRSWFVFGFLLICATLSTLVGCGGSSSSGGGGVSGTVISGTVTGGTPSQPGGIGATPSADIADAIVEALDADGNVIATAMTGADGSYSLRVPNGTYQLGIRVGSTTFFVPLRESVIVQGTSVEGATLTNGVATVDFDVPAPEQTLTGQVNAGGNGAAGVIIEFVDLETNLVRYVATSASDGSFSAAVLPAGRFSARVRGTTVPNGFAVPTPQTIAVTNAGISPANVTFTLPTATTTTGTVTSAAGVAPLANLSPSGDLQPAFVPTGNLDVPPGAEIIVIEQGFGEVARFEMELDGDFTLNLRDGSYLLEFAGLGTDVVAPPPMRITVKDGMIYTEDSDTPLDPTTDSLASTAPEVSATLTGRVLRGSFAMITRVIALDPSTGVILATATTNSLGDYSLPLADGSYDVTLDPEFLPPGTVPPTPVRVATEAGEDVNNPFKEESGTANDGIVNFTLQAASITLTGNVADDGANAVPDVRITARKGDEVVARAVSDSSGAYELRLPVGTLDIVLSRDSLPTGLLAPSATRVETATDGTTSTITTEAGDITTLNFVLETRSPNVTGTITYDFDGSNTVDAGEVVSCRVLVYGPNGDEILGEQASDPNTGTYSLILPNGSYVIGLDPATLPPGTAPPARQKISVTTGAVTEADGTSGASATLDFELVPRAATLTGLVTINTRGTSVGLRLIDVGSGAVAGTVTSEPLTGAYRLPVFQGSYEIRIDKDTLPAGTAVPDPIPIGVEADGTINTATGAITTLNIALTRSVATLTGAITVNRGGNTFPVDVLMEVRDPQSHAVLQDVRTDPETGEYSFLLSAGTKEIAVSPDGIPPGVQPPTPIVVTISGTTISGTGVTNNELDFEINDLRQSGVTITGTVFDASSSNGLFAEVRLFDPNNGSVDENFLLSIPTDANGDFSFKVVDGTYELAVFPPSLPPTALPPSSSTFSIQGNNVIESNTIFVTNQNENAADDGIFKFSVLDGAAQGITVTGTVTDSMANPVPGAAILVRDAATDEPVAETFSDFATGGYTLVLPLGNYSLGVDPNSLPFTLIAEAPVSLLAFDNGGIQVTTDAGAAVAPNGMGDYVFNFQPESASQTLTGTVLDSGGNGVRVFLEVLDAANDQFVLGRWSDVSDGTFQALLAPGSYEVKIDASSLPFGEVPPQPTSIAVTSSAILEDSGTSDDGALAISLISASRSVSGSVTTDGTNLPVAAFVIAFNAQTGDFVNGTPTDPSDGSYSMTIPPGIYEVFVDPPSLPPGYTSPPPTNVNATTADATANFAVGVAAQCITGDVLTATNMLAMPAFVILENASTNQFVTGSPTDPAGNFSICAAAGNYLLKVDPFSLPAGTIAPTAVTVQITAATILEDSTDGAGNNADDGTVNFRVSEDAPNDLAALSGSVTLSSGGNSLPLGAFVFAEETNSGQFVNGIFSDPGNSGNYTLLLPPGSYKIRIEEGSLPPGVAASAPEQVSVAADDTITVLVGGVPVVTSTLNFVLTETQNTLSGSVTLSGSGFPCFVELVDPDDPDFVFNGVPTDPNGDYSIGIPDGSYSLRVSPFSLPPGIVAPAPASVTASSGFVTESVGTSNDGDIDFTLSQSGATLTGYVVDDQNSDVNDDSSNRMFAFITVFDATTGFIVTEGPTDPGQYFSLALADGSYDIVVDPPSLPLDVVPPVPTRISVSGANISVTTAGDGQLDPNSRLRITATRESQAATVNVLVQDGDGNDVIADVEVRDAFGNVLFVFFVPDNGSGTDILLGDGSFSLAVIPGSTPPGLSLPTPTSVNVVGGTPTPANVTITLTSPELSGTITNAVSMGTTLVELDLLNAEGIVLNQNLTLMQSGNDATYDISLGNGSYFLSLRRASGVDSSQVLLPDNVAINVANGVVQNPDDDSGTMGVQVDIDLPEVAATIAGTVTLGGSPVESLDLVLVNTFDNKFVNTATTDASGDYTIGLPAGFYILLPEPGSLAAEAPTAVSPAPLEVNITANGDISIVGQGGLCAAGGPNEDCTGVDFTMVAFNPATDAEITGVIQTRQSSQAPLTAVEGAAVILLNNDFTPLGSTLTDANGAYSLIATDGIYKVIVDPFMVDLGYPIVPPAEVVAVVNGTNVTESDTTGSGNVADDGVVNFILEGATSLVHGQIQTPTGAGVGGVLIVTDASETELPDNFAYTVPADPDGNFFIPIGEGSFKLWVDPVALPPGFVSPQPTTFSVNGTAIIEADTAGTGNQSNDGVINPVLSTGAASVFARVLDASGNGAAAFVALLEPAQNPNDPPFFVSGAPTVPATGDADFTAGDGSYFLEVDPFSLPPGVQPPPKINVSISGGTVSFAAGTETVNVGGDLHAVLRLVSATTEVTGYVQDGSSNAVPSVVVVLDAGTEAFVSDAPVDPATGIYSTTLADGVYDVLVDPFNLPPGLISPPPVRVSVSGANVTESNASGVDPADGVTNNAADDGVVNFTLSSSAVSLTGYVRDPSDNGVFANIGLFAADAAGEYTVFVNGTSSSFSTGFFDIPISDGTYLIGLDPFSLPPGLLAPPAGVISVSGSTITFPSTATTEMEGNETRLILDLQTGGAGVGGTVTDGMGSGIPVFVIAEDAATNQFMGGAQTDANGDYLIPLPAGSYEIFVDPFSIPQGSIAPSPEQVSVASTVVNNVDFTVETASDTFTGNILIEGGSWNDGVSTVDCSDIPASVSADEAYPIGCSIVLLLPSPTPNAPPTFLTETFSNPTTGFFSLPVGNGTYQVAIDGSTLPPGVVPPPPLTLVVSGGTVNLTGSVEDCSNDNSQKVILLSSSSLSIQGVVEDSSSNAVGCFLELTDANTGNFITGTPNNPGDGSFTLPLGDLTYELKVDPFSVPPGFVPPAPVTVSTTGGSISVQTGAGTDYSGNVLTITLSQASSAVSGAVFDSSQNAVSALVQAFTSAGDFANSAWSDPVTGTYSIPLAPGIYDISIDPFSLPAGSAPPATQTANLLEQNSATVNFTVGSAPATVTGSVYFDNMGSDVGVPAFVEIFDATTDSFITGMQAAPDMNNDFIYSLAVGEGTYRIGLDPNSLPPGYVSPAPLNFTVSVNSVTGAVTITETDTTGTGNNANDGTINFELEQAGATLTGKVFYDDMGSDVGVFGFVRVEQNNGTGAIVAEAATDNEGNFTLPLGDGSYLLAVDPGSLPPGFLPPPPQSMTVSGSTISIEGMTVGGTHMIEIFTAGATLTGTITRSSDASAIQGVFVEVLEANTQAFVFGAPTDASGDYSVSLADGTFLVQLDPFSLPSGLIPPAPVEIVVSGANITNNGSPISMLDLQVGGAAASVTIDVTDDQGLPMFVDVEVRDQTNDVIVAQGFVSGMATQLSLPQGSFFVVVPPGSLPPGFSAPPPVSLTVNGDGTTQDSSGNPSDGFIAITVQSAAAVVSGTVTFNGSAIAGVKVAAIEPQSGLEIASFFTDAQGGFNLNLPTGDFELELISGLPMDAVPPPPVLVRVFGPGNVDPSGSIMIAVEQAVGSVAGTVTLDGVGVSGRVIAFADNMGMWEQAAAIETAQDGTFTLPLWEETFVVIAEVEVEALNPVPMQIIAPLPFDADVDTQATTDFMNDFDFFTPGAGGAPASQTLRGSVTAGGAPFEAPLILMYTGKPMALTESDGGSYQLAIMADMQRMFDIGIFPEELPTGFTPPTPVTITVDGTGITGTGVMPDSSDFLLDFDIGVNGVAIQGQVTDGSASPLAGVEVVAVFDNGTPGPVSTTDSMGNYNLILGVGTYDLQLGGGLPSNVVVPVPVEVDVFDNMGTLEIGIDGSPSANGVLDWTVATAVARLSGFIQLNGVGVDGDVEGYLAGNIITETDTNGGSYEIYLPAGAVSAFAIPNTQEVGLVVPTPYTATLSDTGSLQEITYNFNFVTADGMNPGQSIQGLVTSDGMGYECELDIFDANGVLIAIKDTDMQGMWEITLAPGDYTVEVVGDTLPMGYSGTSETDITVSANGVEGPGVEGNQLVFVLNTQGTQLTGMVTDFNQQPIADVVILMEDSGQMGEQLFAVTDANGGYAAVLANGSYELEIDPSSLPNGVVQPPIIDLDAMGGPVQQNYVLLTAEASLSGTVTQGGVGAEAEIIAFDANGDEATFTFTDANGAYTLPVVAGTYTLLAELEQDDLANFLSPDPLAVTVTSGNDQTGLDFAFTAVDPATDAVLTIRILEGGQTVSGEVTLMKDIGGNSVLFAETGTDFDGANHEIVIALTDGDYDLEIDYANNQQVMLSTIDLSVSGTTVTADGQPVPNNQLDVMLSQPFQGSLYYNGAPVVGATMLAVSQDGGTDGMATTDSTGAFSFSMLGNGEYSVTIDPASLPGGAALLHSQQLSVSMQGLSPQRMELCLGAKAGDLTGQVTVDGVGTQAQVLLLDVGMRPIVEADTDASGNYTFALPAGTYNVVAVLETPSGNELAPVVAAVNFTTTATQDYAFTTNASTTLSGAVTFGGMPAPTPILIYAAGPPEVPYTLALPDPMSGNYAVNLPDGTFDILLWPATMPAGFLAPAPIQVTVSGGSVSGNDIDGAAISGNTLNIEPFAMTGQGEVRETVSDFLTAVNDGDTAAFTDLLHDTDTLFSGLDKAAWIADWTQDDDWGMEVIDQVVISLSNVSADEWEVEMERMRFGSLNDDGSARVDFLDNRFTQSEHTIFIVKRDSNMDPWKVAGNGLSQGEAEILHIELNSFDGSTDTVENEVEFLVEESAGEAITSVTVSGTGITNGTLSEQTFPDGDEWLAIVTDSGSSPPPFDATFANLVDGGNYDFTINFSVAPQDMFTMTYNAPVTGLHPMVTVSQVGQSVILMEWEDIAAQLSRPFQEVAVEVVQDNNGQDITLLEDDGLPPGVNCITLDASAFQNGETYFFTVEAIDVGGGSHGYELQITWPLPQP